MMNLTLITKENTESDEICASFDPYLSPDMIQLLSDRPVRVMNENTVTPLYCPIDPGENLVLDEHLLAIA